MSIIPTQDELLDLPAWAILAFAVRCARLCHREFLNDWPGAPDSCLRSIDRSIEEDEEAAETADAGAAARVGWNTGDVQRQAQAAGASRAAEVANAAGAAAFCGYSVASPTEYPVDGDPVVGYGRAAELAAAAGRHACNALPGLGNTIRRDFELLRSASKREAWSNSSPVSSRFFSADSLIERRVLLAVNDLCVRLCQLIAENGETIRFVEWRQLEEVIAAALDGIGFRVELTPSSKDGGKDVIAECSIAGEEHTYYLEIKHWRSGKKAGPQDVSHFVEVNVSDGTKGGLFLSSSGFAPTVFAQSV